MSEAVKKRNLFEKRVAFKPFEYPEIIPFKDAINHSYWLVSEWNFVGDVQDFHTKLSEQERGVIKKTMLAISQIEVAVKKFWSKLGDRFPKAEFDQVGITFGDSECNIDGTEIMTPNGWKDLKDISVGDEVMQFHEDNTLSITKVLHKIDKEYSGNLMKFHKVSTTAIVTPDHDMVCYNSKNQFIKTKAKDLVVKNTCLKIPEAATIQGGTISKLSFMDRLRIAIQADGHKVYKKRSKTGVLYHIAIKKERKIKRLDWILENLPDVNYSKEPKPSNPGVWLYIIDIDDDYDYKELEWVDIKDKTVDWCVDFIDEISNWDGQKIKSGKDCKIRFTNTNKSAADTVQLVGVCAGYRTNMYVRKDNRSVLYNDVYYVSFTSNRLRVTLPPLKKDIIEYDGMVRCVTVESGAILTRYNGKTFISGNCRHADSYSHLLEILGFNQEFEKLLTIPVIRKRVDYLSESIKGSDKQTNEQYALTLALFSIFIENISLFSQFVIIKSFNKYKNVLKDIDNVVQATSLEEGVHALFGMKVLNLLKEENPDWFNEDFYNHLYQVCEKAISIECEIIDWIFEQGELDFLAKSTLKEFIKSRLNDSLEQIGGLRYFEVDKDEVGKLSWFEDEIYGEISTDFFNKKSVAYSKSVQAITAEDIF